MNELNVLLALDRAIDRCAYRYAAGYAFARDVAHELGFGVTSSQVARVASVLSRLRKGGLVRRDRAGQMWAVTKSGGGLVSELRRTLAA